MMTKTFFAVVVMIGFANAHGIITSPKPRMAGPAMKAACGQQVYNNQASDDGGNIQGMLQVAKTQTDYNAAACQIWQCKGYKAADNTANVQSFTTGQVVPITFAVRAPHTGTANVSIVDTASNSVIGQPLASYAVFGSTSTTIPANETSFSVTIPDLGGKCTTAGDCVIQHFWDARSIDQTYESCIDFTVGGTAASGAPAAVAVSSVAKAAVPTTFATSIVAQVATSVASSAATAATGGANQAKGCGA